MREATTFSRILEMKLRFEIGRKLLRSSVDRDGFLRRGWTRACLNDDGKIPSEREIDKICDDWTEFVEAEKTLESRNLPILQRINDNVSLIAPS